MRISFIRKNSFFCNFNGVSQNCRSNYSKNERKNTMQDLKISLGIGAAFGGITAVTMTCKKQPKILLNSAEIGFAVAGFTFIAQLLTDKFYKKNYF